MLFLQAVCLKNGQWLLNSRQAYQDQRVYGLNSSDEADLSSIGHFEFDLEEVLVYFDIRRESDREMFEFASRPSPIGHSESSHYCIEGPFLGMNILVNIIGLFV
jgi:hypothetical protein